MLRDKIVAMPFIAVGLSMLAGELVEPAKRIRALFDNLRGA